MRIVVEVRKEREQTLREQAWREHRTVQEHAAYLLNLKIDEFEAETEQLQQAG